MSRKFKKKIKKYTQKGPSSRIKNPVRPIKKTVMGPGGKPVERTYYKLISKNNNLRIDKRKKSEEINKNTPSIKKDSVNLNKKDKLKFKIELKDLKRLDKNNPNKINKRDDSIKDAKDIKDLADRLGVSEEAMRQFICKI